MMRNSMKLRVALAMSMLISPLYAGQKIGYAQKAVKVAVHSGTVMGGALCGFLSYQTFFDLRDSYKEYFARSQGSQGGDYSLSDKFVYDDLKNNLKYELVFCGAALCSFYSGLSGLDRELHVRYHVKQLISKLMGKVRRVSKK